MPRLDSCLRARHGKNSSELLSWSVVFVHRHIPRHPSEVSSAKPGWNEALLSRQECCWWGRRGLVLGSALRCDQLRFAPKPLLSRRVLGRCQSHAIQGDLEWLRLPVSRWYRYTLDHLWRRCLSSSWARSLDVLTLSPAHVPWSYHRTSSRWTPASGCLRCHQRPAVRFPQASHHTIMWAGTTASWSHTTALKHQCYLCAWLSRVQTSPCSVGAGMPTLPAGVLMVTSSRHAWKLDCTSTSASPGNVLWLWLWRMHHFSTTAICHTSFGACMQLRGKRLCSAWTLQGWLCLCVSSTARGAGTEDHHVVVTCAFCSADECPVFSPGLCNDLVLQGGYGVGAVLHLTLECRKGLSQEFCTAEAGLLLGVCNQCLSVVLSEVKVRWCHFYWSVAHHKLLILIEQPLQCSRLVVYL